MIVVDTSVLVEYLTGRDSRADKVRLRMRGERLAAPHGIDLECLSSLRGLVLGRKVPAQEAGRAIGALRRLRIARYAYQPLVSRIWELRHNMWPYDAAYIALAERLQVELITIDGKFAFVPHLKCVVNHIPEG